MSLKIKILRDSCILRGCLLLALSFWGALHAHPHEYNPDKLEHLALMIEEKIMYDANASYDLSLDYYALSIESRDSIQMANALNYLATSQYYRNKLKSAGEYAHKALHLYQKLEDSSGLGAVYNILGNISADQAQYIKALDYYRHALNMEASAEKPETRGVINLNIAFIYLEQYNYRLAEKHFITALQIAETHNFSSLLLSTLNGLVEIYLEKGEVSKAEIAVERAFSLAALENDKLELSAAHMNEGLIYSYKGDYEKAFPAMRKAIALSREFGDNYSTALYHQQLAQAHLAAGNVHIALEYAKQAYTMASRESTPFLLRETAMTLSDAWERHGNASEALKYYKIYHTHHNTLLSINVQEKILRDANASALDKNDFLEAQNALNREIIKRNNWIFSVVGFCILSLLFFIYYFKTSRDRHRKSEELLTQRNENIARQQTEIHEQKEKLIRQNCELEHLNSTKDKLFSILTHDLKQPFHQMLALLNLLESDSKSHSDEYRELIGEIKESTNHTHSAVENLLIWSKNQFRGLVVSKAKTSLKQIIYDLERQCSSSLRAKNVQIKYTLDYHLYAWSDPNQVEIILRNLLINALKFSPPDSTIEVVGKRLQTQIKLSIIDQGVGMSEEQIDNLLSFSENLSTPGTLNEKGTGLGILIVQEFLQANQGKLQIKSRLQHGSCFTIFLPAYEAPTHQGAGESHPHWKLN